MNAVTQNAQGKMLMPKMTSKVYVHKRNPMCEIERTANDSLFNIIFNYFI